MDARRQNLLSRLIAAALYTAVMAGTWDAWWHGAIGRESFWEPPHLLLYTAVMVAFVGAIYGWSKTGEARWRRLMIALFLVPLSAPFDDLWHRLFGKEEISSILIIWSPPHLVLIGGLAASCLLLLPLVKRDSDRDAQWLFGGLIFAALLSLSFFLAGPFIPTEPHRLLGFWGAGITGGLFAAMALLASKHLPGLGGATLTAAFFLLTASIGFGIKFAPEVPLKPHAHPPGWLTLFSYLAPAVLIDLLKKPPLWIKGALAGALWAGLLYGFSSRFFEPQFQYSSLEAAQAVLASALGGLASGIAISIFSKKK